MTTPSSGLSLSCKLLHQVSPASRIAEPVPNRLTLQQITINMKKNTKNKGSEE
jgi:hypothetical protein